jgi:putative phosphoribosyl transferase
MYFKNRAEAGRLLAKDLEKYAGQNVVVVALSQGAVIVGAQIAMQIHGSLLLFLCENIYLPGETEAIAGMSSTGNFAYNQNFSMGQLEELTGEFRNFLEQQRIMKIHELNILVGKDGEIHKEYLRHHVVILVSDGLASGLSLDIAGDYLKRVALKKLVVATPFASVPAVDHMHLVADEISCLSVLPNFMGINHYYEDNTIPAIDDLFRVTKNITLHWKHNHIPANRT